MNSTDLSSIVENKPKTNQQISLRVAGYYAIIMLIGVVAAILGPSIPALAESTRSAIGLMGFLFTVRSSGGLLGSFLSGRLYDRFAGHLILALTLVSLACAVSIVPLIDTLWVLWIIIFFWGLGESFLDVGVNTHLVWTYKERSAPYLNALHFFFGLGALLAPILFVQIVNRTGQFDWSYWLLAAAMLPVAVWIFLVPGPSPQIDDDTHGQASLNVPILLICIIFFLYVGAEVSYGGWIYSYAISQNLAGTASAGYLNSAFWGMLTLGRLLAVVAAIYIRPNRLLTGALLGTILSVALLLFVTPTQQTLWIGTLGLGFCMAPIFPTLLALAGRRMTLTGKVTSWFFIASNIGGMTFPWLAGILFEVINPQAILSLLFTVLLLALVTLGLLGRILPPHPHREVEST